VCTVDIRLVMESHAGGGIYLYRERRLRSDMTRLYIYDLKTLLETKRSNRVLLGTMFTY